MSKRKGHQGFVSQRVPGMVAEAVVGCALHWYGAWRFQSVLSLSSAWEGGLLSPLCADEEIVKEKVSELSTSGNNLMIELDPEINSTSSYWS